MDLINSALPYFKNWWNSLAIAFIGGFLIGFLPFGFLFDLILSFTFGIACSMLYSAANK